jgi:hypothetical protein
MPARAESLVMAIKCRLFRKRETTSKRSGNDMEKGRIFLKSGIERPEF